MHKGVYSKLDPRHGVIAALLAAAWLVRKRRTEKAAERLSAALFETLLGAIDANDAETGAHVRRVARYALILARGARLSDRDQRTIERVALFHDVGKIHEALLDIVRDEGTLTPEQRREISTHTVRGAEVLEPLAAFYPDLPLGVLHHHERWDGSGYPCGLRGTRIPLASRIVAIADTFDVVTHGRHYSTRRSLEEARAIVGHGQGTQFDPVLASLFLSDRVYPSIVRAVHECLRRAPNPSDERRTHEQEGSVPDVTFRWRSGAPAPRRRDRVPRIRHG